MEQRYFEVWNEPRVTQFFAGDIKEYFRLYQVTAKAIKVASGTYKAGEPDIEKTIAVKNGLRTSNFAIKQYIFYKKKPDIN